VARPVGGVAGSPADGRCRRSQESAHWIPLVERCPWDAARPEPLPRPPPRCPSRGADRFTWTIEARIDGRSHRAIVSEADAQGAWRALIDAVRAATPSAR
jgi:hypothetical protein